MRVTAMLLLLFLAAPARAALSVYVPPEDLAATAPLVVRGEVVRRASGFDPERGTLRTYVTLDVQEVLRGTLSASQIVLREAGGRFGDVAHEVDAVPVYTPGEQVLVFLEPARDGALRTCAQFFGKYTADATDPTQLVRDLSGQGTILFRPAGEKETASLSTLRHLVAAPAHPVARPFRAAPAEMDRLLWDDVGVKATAITSPSTGGALLAARPASGSVQPSFVPLAPAAPTRWAEIDAGASVIVNVQPGGNPLGNDALAVEQIRRAAAAWTEAPESRLSVVLGNTADTFTATQASGPADAMPPRNIVLFNDPYDDITPPSGCSGTLAIGGYWRSGSLTSTVNGVSFYPALRLYVIFNTNFSCFLGIADNLAEVATHELGHGLGFGHSAVADATMAAYAYGNRGPRLGNDDKDAAHCHYPRALTLTSPNGGETWAAGTVHAVTWTSPAEAGPDAGTVTVEWSADSGNSWSTVAAGEPDDGTYLWVVPDSQGWGRRVRVRRYNRVVPTPAPYPAACSQDASDASFTIGPPPSAGVVPDSMKVAFSAGSLTLTWDGSCTGQASGYAVYEGTLSALRAGMSDLEPVTCAAGTDLTETFVPGAGNRYYVIAATVSGAEGALGAASTGMARLPSADACAPRETASCP
ncbi:MAG TPA: matrixin family metalloprotease [Candidatus Polarisedimenticolaceae bacterium]|nr:matrixin family metalloprotease [Candidatus Polarisedimenticolaceae bacterium]